MRQQKVIAMRWLSLGCEGSLKMKPVVVCGDEVGAETSDGRSSEEVR